MKLERKNVSYKDACRLDLLRAALVSICLVVFATSGNANVVTNLFRVVVDGKVGFIDETGRLRIAARFDYALDFSEGLAGVAVNNKWGYINTDGKVVVPLKFSKANQFSDGLAAVHAADQKVGYIDKSGVFVISAKFDFGGPFVAGLAPVQQGEQYGFIDKKGETVVSFDFCSVQPFYDEDFAPVKKNGKETGT